MVDALGVEALGQLVGALLDHGVELGVGYVGQLDIEDLAGQRRHAREEAVEEDGVEDSCRIKLLVKLPRREQKG